MLQGKMIRCYTSTHDVLTSESVTDRQFYCWVYLRCMYGGVQALRCETHKRSWNVQAVKIACTVCLGRTVNSQIIAFAFGLFV